MRIHKQACEQRSRATVRERESEIETERDRESREQREQREREREQRAERERERQRQRERQRESGRWQSLEVLYVSQSKKERQLFAARRETEQYMRRRCSEPVFHAMPPSRSRSRSAHAYCGDLTTDRGIFWQFQSV